MFSPAIKVLLTSPECLAQAGDSCQRLWIVVIDITVKGELWLTPCQVMTRVPSLSQFYVNRAILNAKLAWHCAVQFMIKCVKVRVEHQQVVHKFLLVTFKVCQYHHSMSCFLTFGFLLIFVNSISWSQTPWSWRSVSRITWIVKDGALTMKA